MSEALATRGYTTDTMGGGLSAPTLTVAINTVDVVWSTNVTLTVIGQVAANWVISNFVGQPVAVTAVSQLNATTVRLTTSDQTSGGSYAVDVAAASNVDAVTGDPNPFFSIGFIGVGHLPSLVSAVPETTTTLVATFNEPVVAVEALVPTNYTFDGGLVTQAVAQVSATQFRVTISEMFPGVIYTMTVGGIHDLAGNPVT